MGILLLTPFFLIRFGLLALLNRDAVKDAARFAPVEGNETAAYWLYQVSNAAMILAMLFERPRSVPKWLFAAGLAVYGMGTFLLTVSIVNFAAPTANGFHRNGLYRLSRNPMYVAYFVFFLGCVLVTQSQALFVFLMIFQISAHWMIRAEERWCTRKFGEEYLAYKKEVRRYL